MKILVVDDAAFMRLMIRNLLEKQGYEVFEAASGEEALEAYEGLPGALVTLDLTMPGMGGMAALAALKARDPQARILMVSSTGRPEAINEALAAGASDFIVKPFQPERLLNAVAQALAEPAL